MNPISIIYIEYSLITKQYKEIGDVLVILVISDMTTELKYLYAPNHEKGV
jgi:hypothetical protein